LARRAVYGRNSFRALDLGFRDRHFEAVEREWHLKERVRGCVQWQQGNMLDAAFLAGAAPYDVIFCRNLLIYFDAATQGRAVAVLRRLLAPQGLLLAGHSESGWSRRMALPRRRSRWPLPSARRKRWWRRSRLPEYRPDR
jgi:chemotaxis protein methyltransferase WspC